MSGSIALVTPSWAGDLERCRLLCESVDRHLTGHDEHLILVEPDDVARFAPLAGPRRRVIDERDLLPDWLHRGREPSGRRFWWSWRTSRPSWLPVPGLPLRGWHAQQLRRIAVARTGAADAYLYADSDMMFVRPFDVASLWRDGALRLYRVEGGIHAGLPEGGATHIAWTVHAARILGLDAPAFPAADHINNLVSWRGDHVRALCERIEEVTGRHWVAAIASARQFSECQIYGAYTHDVAGMAGHWATAEPLARTYWAGDALDAGSLAAFVKGMAPSQVAVGIQSFTGTDPALLRGLLA